LNQSRLLSRFVRGHFVPAQTAPIGGSLVKRTLYGRLRRKKYLNLIGEKHEFI